MRLEDVFPVKKPIIGMIHLNGFWAERVLEIAKQEIEQYYSNGVDAVLVENYYGDVEDVISVLDYLQHNYPDRIYGVNVLGEFKESYELAQKYGAAFMQVDSICGHLNPKRDKQYEKLIAETRSTGVPVFVMGGVRFKYQPVNSGRSLEEDLKLAMERCDAIVVTGSGTGINTDMEKIRKFKEMIGDFPLIVGAGMQLETCQEQLKIADGGIVGSYFKVRGVTELSVDAVRVRNFMNRVVELR